MRNAHGSRFPDRPLRDSSCDADFPNHVGGSRVSVKLRPAPDPVACSRSCVGITASPLRLLCLQQGRSEGAILEMEGDFYRTFGMGSFCQFDLPRTTPLSWTFHGRGAAAKSSRTDFPIEFGGSSRKGPKSGIRRNRQGDSTLWGWGAGLIPAHCHPFPGGWSAIGIERRGSPRVGSSPLASLPF
jgi:hypothetical protein